MRTARVNCRASGHFGQSPCALRRGCLVKMPRSPWANAPALLGEGHGSNAKRRASMAGVNSRAGYPRNRPGAATPHGVHVRWGRQQPRTLLRMPGASPHCLVGSPRSQSTYQSASHSVGKSSQRQPISCWLAVWLHDCWNGWTWLARVAWLPCRKASGTPPRGSIAPMHWAPVRAAQRHRLSAL